MRFYLMLLFNVVQNYYFSLAIINDRLWQTPCTCRVTAKGNASDMTACCRDCYTLICTVSPHKSAPANLKSNDFTWGDTSHCNLSIFFVGIIYSRCTLRSDECGLPCLHWVKVNISQECFTSNCKCSCLFR